MDNFDDEEKFYRKVPPNPNMIKQNGTITSAAFKDSKGLKILKVVLSIVKKIEMKVM